MLQKTLAALLFCAALLVACEHPAPAVTSTIITNARIIDGSGSEAFPGAVRIDGDRIVDIGALESLEGETVVDAGGLVLAPGFIDTHSHHDSKIAEYRHMPGVLSQGVTTITRGMDGFSDDADQFSFVPFADYKPLFAAAPAAVNFASFSPHNSIRRQVMGEDYRREASTDEILAMAKLLAADMQAGALGLSTGLEYEPGIYASTEEIISLARVTAKFSGTYTSHLRDEDDHLIDAVQELIRIGKEAALPVNISHIKIADRASWGTAGALLAMLDDARRDSVNVTADIYPYQRWASDLSILFPERDFTDRSVAEFTFAHTALPANIILADFPPNPAFNGLSIADIAAATEQDAESTLLELTQAADNYQRETGRAGSAIIAKGMDEADITALMQWEFANICSDGGHGGGHPRGYGTFPRVLGRYVRELGVLTLPQAIYKMTGLPASTLGIKDRGRIRTGYYADLVLFDPDTISDKATMQDPTALSVGIDKVWVNGVLAYDNGKPTLDYPGRLVLRGGP